MPRDHQRISGFYPSRCGARLPGLRCLEKLSPADLALGIAQGRPVNEVIQVGKFTTIKVKVHTEPPNVYKTPLLLSGSGSGFCPVLIDKVGQAFKGFEMLFDFSRWNFAAIFKLHGQHDVHCVQGVDEPGLNQ